jgi:alpha-methylacyl-CoA racemase
MYEVFAEIFASETRDHWVEVFSSSDACVAPVMSLREAPDHPHLAARRTFVTTADGPMPGPAPRFSRSNPDGPTPAPQPGEHTDQVLGEAGFDAADIVRLRQIGAVG